jgi:Tfp pilus assembly protein PilO
MKQRKPLPKAAVLGLMVVVAILVAFLGNKVLVGPQKTKLNDVNEQITEAQTKLTQYASDLAAARDKQVPKIRIADVYRLARAMPSTEDMPDVLIELNDLASACGIHLDAITPSTPTPGNGFEVVSISISFASDFYRTTDFLFRLRTLVAVRHGQLESTGRLYSVQNVSIVPGGSTALSVAATVQAYIYGGVPAAPTAPVTPATTDTTGSTGQTTTSTGSSSASAEQGVQ